MKRTIKLTEQELHSIITESVKKIFEYNYKNHDQKIKVAQYLSGKNRDEMRDEWKDLIAKRTAIADINRERDILSLDSHEKEFNKQISSKTFDINFDDLYDNIYDDVL